MYRHSQNQNLVFVSPKSDITVSYEAGKNCTYKLPSVPNFFDK